MPPSPLPPRPPPPIGSPHPYIPATAEDRARMLQRLGLSDTAELFADLPEARRDPPIALLPALTESELIALLEERAAQNADPGRPSYLPRA